jgi:hypothetical protein
MIKCNYKLCVKVISKSDYQSKPLQKKSLISPIRVVICARVAVHILSHKISIFNSGILIPLVLPSVTEYKNVNQGAAVLYRTTGRAQFCGLHRCWVEHMRNWWHASRPTRTNHYLMNERSGDKSLLQLTRGPTLVIWTHKKFGLVSVWRHVPTWKLSVSRH